MTGAVSAIAAMLAFSAFSELKRHRLSTRMSTSAIRSDVMAGHDHALPGDVDPHHHRLPLATCSICQRPVWVDPSIRRARYRLRGIIRPSRFRFGSQKNFIRSQFMENRQDKWAAELAF